MPNKYDVWYATVTDHATERHFVAKDLPFRKAHEIKRGHLLRHYIHVTQSAQQCVQRTGVDADDPTPENIQRVRETSVTVLKLPRR